MAESVDLLKNAVVSGVQLMIALSLDGSPGHETVGLTAMAWVEIVKSWNLKNTPEDSQRVSAAFKALASQVTRWPAPAQLKPYLPAPIKAVNDVLALPYPKDKQRENLNMLKSLLKTAAVVMDGTSTEAEREAARHQLAKQSEAVNKQVAQRNKT